VQTATDKLQRTVHIWSFKTRHVVFLFRRLKNLYEEIPYFPTVLVLKLIFRYPSSVQFKTSIHWQNVRVTEAVESKFLTTITLINNRKFNCIIETYQRYCFSVNMKKKDSFIQEQCPSSPPPWTEPKLLIQTYQTGGSMHFQSGVLPLSLIFKGGGRVQQYFWFSKRVSRCLLFLPILTKYSWGSDPLDSPMSQ
jgi:hypothetical protein